MNVDKFVHQFALAFTFIGSIFMISRLAVYDYDGVDKLLMVVGACLNAAFFLSLINPRRQT